MGTRGQHLPLRRDYSEGSCQVFVRAGCEEELIGPAVGSGATSELNSPKFIDGDYFSICVFNCADELSRRQVEGVDGSAAGVVGDEQRVAELAEILGGDSETPGIAQRCAFCELPDEC